MTDKRTPAHPFVFSFIALGILFGGCSKNESPEKAIPAPPIVEPALTDSPPYADRSRFSEHEIVVNPGKRQLPGTLSIPKSEGTTPGVIIVHGTGPTDRDGTFVHSRRFRDIAWGLASQGIAVLRFDKRSFVHKQPVQTVEDEVLNDVIAAVRVLRNTQSVNADKIYILGHSLGGTLTPRILKMDKNLAGGIVLAGASRPLEDSYHEQYVYLMENTKGEPTAESKKMIDDAIAESVAKRDRIRSLTKADLNAGAQGVWGYPLSWWLDMRSYNPTEVARTLEVPLLVLYGEKDEQVFEKDFLYWKEQLREQRVSFRKYPTLNHLFFDDQGSGLSGYGRAGQFVDQTVIEDIVHWISEDGFPFP